MRLSISTVVGFAAITITGVSAGWSSDTTSHFLTDNPLPHGFPWGDKTSHNSNHHRDAPVTGVTRYYNFTVSRQIADIDGFQKKGILVNDQFPGPLIEANWGDWVQITVNNKLTAPEEGATLHWHGFEQRGTQYMDGAPTIGQCPIAPGASFTYRFRADQYGSSWYHSHYSAQYADGAVGPIVVHGPKHVDYDHDLGPVLIGDYFHRDYLSNVADSVGTNNDFNVYVPPSDNNFINGKVSWRYDCPTQSKYPNSTALTNSSALTSSSTCSLSESYSDLEKFQFQAGKSHRLRIANTGAAAFEYFSIDGHDLEVITNDFVPIVSYNTTFIGLGMGQRADVLVHGDADPTQNYWMRATVGVNCSRGSVNETKALIFYEPERADQVPTSTPQALPPTTVMCKNEDLNKTVPFYPIPVDAHPEAVKVVELNFTSNSSGNHIWTMNEQTYRGNYNDPLLLLADRNDDPNNSSIYDPEWLVYNFGSAKTVRIVLNNAYQAWHPMHLHGYHMQVIAEGDGYWDGTITNPSNPLRRDTHILRRYGHLVIQFQADNPGIWPYHCHIAWHLSAGFNMNIMTQPQEIHNAGIPYIMEQTCRDWEAYSSRNVVEQIDAGL